MKKILAVLLVCIIAMIVYAGETVETSELKVAALSELKCVRCGLVYDALHLPRPLPAFCCRCASDNFLYIYEWMSPQEVPNNDAEPN